MLGIAGSGYLGCASGLEPGTTTACPDGWNADLRTLFSM